MRFRRAVEMTTPSAIGIAPPDRPVPAPRGTIGTRSRRQTLMDGDHLRLVGWQHHDHGQLAVGRQAVAFVRPGVFLVEQHRALGQGGAQRFDDFTLARNGKLRSFWSIHGMDPDRR